jgi:hypothetical protein
MASGAAIRSATGTGRNLNGTLYHHVEEQVAPRQSSPFTGKLSARPAGKPGDLFHDLENLRRSLQRHSFSATARTIRMRFSGMAESIWSDVVSQSKPNPRAGPDRLPLVGPEPG